MARVSWTKKIFRLHSWLGLIFGVLFLIIGVSGSVLVFDAELDALLFSKLHKVDPQARRVSLDEIYENVRRTYPESWGIRFRELHLDDPRRSIQLAYSHRSHVSDKDWFYLYADPYSGDILGRQNALGTWGFRHNPVDWFLWLHFALLAGQWGQLVVGVVSITFAGSLITGLIVYRKKLLGTLLLRIPLKFRSKRAFWSGLHRLVGVWSLILNLVLAATGFWMMRYVFSPEIYQAGKEPDRTPAAALTFSIDAMLDDVRTSHPEFLPTGLSVVPHEATAMKIYGKPRASWPIFGESSETVTYDIRQQTITQTSLLAEQTFGQKFERVFLELHFGQFGGWPVKVIYVLIGLSPGLLALSGTWIWWMRRKRR